MVACQLHHSDDCPTTCKRYSTREIFNHEELRQIARVEEHDKDLQQRAKELFNIDLSQSMANRLRNAVRPKPIASMPDVTEEVNPTNDHTKQNTETDAILSDNCDLNTLPVSAPIAVAPVKKVRQNKRARRNQITNDVVSAAEALISNSTYSAVPPLPQNLDLSAFVYTEQV